MKYSKKFKEEALKLSDEIGVKKAATQLGLHYYTLAEWRKNRKSKAEDTRLYLLDSTYALIAESDDISITNAYSKITSYLTQGQTYKVLIFTYPYNLSYDCYLAIYKQGSLIGATQSGDISDYAAFVKNFNKIGDYTNTYNCLAHAIGITNDWVWPWYNNNPTVAETTSYMNSIGYEQIPSYSVNCIVAYGTSDSCITHFSKSVHGTVTAKCGGWELVRHIGYNVYFANGSYGEPRAYYVKSSSKSVSGSSLTLDTKLDSINMQNLFANFVDNELETQVYDVIDNLEINEYTLNNGYNLIDENPEAYMALYTLGYESIPYILKYVIEFDERGMFGAFLVSCANQIAGQDMMVGSIGSNYVAECNYEPYSPRWYACQLMLFLYNN